MKTYPLQYGSGRVLPLGMGRFFASVILTIKVPFRFLLNLRDASDGTYLSAKMMSPLLFIMHSSSGGSVCQKYPYYNSSCCYNSKLLLPCPAERTTWRTGHRRPAQPWASSPRPGSRCGRTCRCATPRSTSSSSQPRCEASQTEQKNPLELC